MKEYYVKVNSVCVHFHCEDKEYGSWIQKYETSINEISLIQCDYEYESVVSLHDFKIGDSCFLVWIEYSDGDSFGTKTGCYDLQYLAKTREEAEEYVKVIQKMIDDEKHRIDINGIPLMNPCYDYFVVLEKIHIDKFIIK